MTHTTDQLRALERARTAVQTLLRLDEIRSAGNDLTFHQSEDFEEAKRAWNDAAAIVPELPSWTPAQWTDHELRIAVRALQLAAPAVEMRSRMEGDPTLAAIMNMQSGERRASAPDEIRSMLASGERQYDFAFLETDAIRALPSADGDEIRAITNFDDGASLHVDAFAAWVAVYARTISPWLGLSTVTTSANGRPLVVPKLTGDPTVYTPGEGTAITASDVTLTTVTVTPTGYKALMLVSAEAFEDEAVNLTQQIAFAQARAIGIAFGSDATTAVLAGINNGGTASGVGGYGTAAGAFFGYEDLVDLQMSRQAPYRANGAWIMANGAITKAKKWRDGQGNYLWPSGQLPIGGQVYEDPSLATPASATKSVIYGDPRAGLIIKASPIRVAVSTDYKFNEDVVAIKTVHRIALAVQDPTALAYLVSAAT